MRPAINLNYQFSFETDEIYDVGADWDLPAEFLFGQLTIAQLFPQSFFSRSGIDAELFCGFEFLAFSHTLTYPTLLKQCGPLSSPAVR